MVDIEKIIKGVVGTGCAVGAYILLQLMGDKLIREVRQPELTKLEQVVTANQNTSVTIKEKNEQKPNQTVQQPVYKEKKYDIICNVVLKEDGFYKSNGADEMFDLAQQFFKEKVGINIGFTFYRSEDDIPSYNNKNLFKIVELYPEEIQKQVVDKKIEYIRKKRLMLSDFLKKMVNAKQNTEKQDHEYYDKSLGKMMEEVDRFNDALESSNDNAIIETSENIDECDRMILALEMNKTNYQSTIAGEADIEKGIAYLNDPITLTNYTGLVAIDTFTEKLNGDNSRKAHNAAVQLGANNIAHEVAHLFGLKHPCGTNEGEICEKIGKYTLSGRPNLMSYEKPDKKDMFGYDIEKSQIDQIKSYISKNGLKAK